MTGWKKNRCIFVRVDREDVFTAAREQGIEDLDAVKFAIVERNGAISIIEKKP
jgi:uncharacterized membrane protein YcaP (DUF421 family)